MSVFAPGRGGFVSVRGGSLPEASPNVVFVVMGMMMMVMVIYLFNPRQLMMMNMMMMMMNITIWF